MRLALAAAVIGAAGAAHAAEPQALSFTSGGDAYVVPAGGLASVELGDPAGLTLCFAPDAERALAAFTQSHSGEVVTVAIGDSEVFHLTVTKPYAGGCIDWPLHPRIAEAYRGRLLGDDAEGK